MYDLYTQATPNGFKIPIALEELGAGYTVHEIQLAKGEQKADWFRALNPAGKIPTLYDRRIGEAVWESNAILLHLAAQHDALFPRPGEGAAYREGLARLFYQASSVGPALTYLFQVAFMARETDAFAIRKFEKESRRVLAVLDELLAGRSYFLGERYSIADITHLPWIHAAYGMGEPVDDHPNLAAWFERLSQRPAVRAGLAVPKPMTAADMPPRKRVD